MNHDEMLRLWGPWVTRTPADVAELLTGFGPVWWIAGGWAIEAFTGAKRDHSDVDPSICRSDIAPLYRHLSGRKDVWIADSGTFRALLDADDPVPRTCENLWLRAGGAEPWEYDVSLMDATSESWTFKRDPRITLPLHDILWTKEGIRYLRPEVQLLHKARGLRPQDQLDFDASAPLLDTASVRWLRWALDVAHPGHPWINSL
ncbi:hypothetical protein [Nocardioides lijunqiniae]|uniref:hypothetical protein n=1 Tax=Nocardioides lijunqiniae TaxID=2760832 RepID=UPI001D0C2638|nr:hypothetical protein [Nocardioides lijunqiniae]